MLLIIAKLLIWMNLNYNEKQHILAFGCNETLKEHIDDNITSNGWLVSDTIFQETLTFSGQW